MGLKVLYRVVAGKHAYRDPKTNKLTTLIKGTKVASESDLTLKFPNKFEKVFPDEGETVDGGAVNRALALRKKKQEEEEVEKELNEEEEDPVETDESEDAADEGGESDLGTDVTERFVNVQKAGFTVYDQGGVLSVYKGEDFIVGELNGKVELLTWYKSWKASKGKKKPKA